MLEVVEEIPEREPEEEPEEEEEEEELLPELMLLPLLPRPPPPPLRLKRALEEFAIFASDAGKASAWMVVASPRRRSRVCGIFMVSVCGPD